MNKYELFGENIYIHLIDEQNNSIYYVNEVSFSKA